ncbi:MAG: beta strand repeat-containing protein, partial [Gemmataceae bacterium]
MLASFNGTNGLAPQAGLIMDRSGNLYGTTLAGGAFGDNPGYGTVFELAQGSSTITTLASFNGSNGSEPSGRLLTDGSGNLYGTTDFGGVSNDGTIFELVQGSGTITTLASFNGSNGSEPSGSLIMDDTGNLYGTAEGGGGTVFELAQNSGTITTLASFNGTNGLGPQDGLIMDSSGNLYGTTVDGGVSNDGTIFELQGVASAAPTITGQPSSQTVTAGSNVSFTASANGNPTPSVQWQISTDGGATFTDISGAADTTLTLNGVTGAINGDEYQAVFTNSAGSATTSAATLTVQYAPTVTTNPISQTVTAGGNVSFTALASGNPTPTVQWQISTDGGTTFSNISGATDTTLTLTGVTSTMDDDEFEAVFTNNVGNATTSAATLTVQYAPTVTTNPISQTVTAGGDVSFTASASGNPTPSVQWQISTDGGTVWTDISGATSTTLTLTGITSAMDGDEYEAVFTNSVGDATTSAATLAVQYVPTVTTNPISQTVTAGSNVSFTASASGNPTPTMQWQISTDGGTVWTDISGATSTTLTLNNFITTMTGYEYQAVFTNSIGSATTNAATLTVNAVPIILYPSSLSPETAGSAYSQNIIAIGGIGALSVSYNLTSGAIPAGLTFTPGVYQLTITGTPSASGSVTFSVTARDAFGDTTTQSYTLAVNPAPKPPPPPHSPHSPHS